MRKKWWFWIRAGHSDRLSVHLHSDCVGPYPGWTACRVAPSRHAVARGNPASCRAASTRRPQSPYGYGTGNAEPVRRPRLSSVISASGQLLEDWPSSGQTRRRVAMYARSLQTCRRSAPSANTYSNTYPCRQGRVSAAANAQDTARINLPVDSQTIYTGQACKTIIHGGPDMHDVR